MARQVELVRSITERVRRLGSPVAYDPGWDRRGSTSFEPRGHTLHHTGTDRDIRRILAEGHGRLAGSPIANWGAELAGTLVVIAAGRANHAGKGGYRGLTGNASVLGTEVTTSGGRITDAQLRTLDDLHVALDEHGISIDLQHTHALWSPGRKHDIAGEPMAAPGKPWDFDRYRARIRVLRGAPVNHDQEDDDMPAPDEVMAEVEYEGGKAQVQWDGGVRLVEGAGWPHGGKQAFSYPGLPAGARLEPPGQPRRFRVITRDVVDARRRGFSLVSTAGERYRFPAKAA